MASAESRVFELRRAIRGLGTQPRPDPPTPGDVSVDSRDSRLNESRGGLYEPASRLNESRDSRGGLYDPASRLNESRDSRLNESRDWRSGDDLVSRLNESRDSRGVTYDRDSRLQ